MTDEEYRTRQLTALDRLATAAERLLEYGITIRVENTDYPIAVRDVERR